MNNLATQILSTTVNTAGGAATEILNEQTRNSTNLTRTRLGKQPCTRTADQPSDCPLPLFSVITPAGSDGKGSDGRGSPADDGPSPMVMVMGVIGVGAIIAFLLTRKPKPKARRKSRKSR